MSEDFILGLTKLFNENRKTTVPAEVRQKLGILNKGNFKLLWVYDKTSDRVYVQVSKPSLGSYDAKPYRQ